MQRNYIIISFLHGISLTRDVREKQRKKREKKQRNKFNANVMRQIHTLRLEEITSKYRIYVSLFDAFEELSSDLILLRTHQTLWDRGGVDSECHEDISRSRVVSIKVASRQVQRSWMSHLSDIWCSFSYSQSILVGVFLRKVTFISSWIWSDMTSLANNWRE